MSHLKGVALFATCLVILLGLGLLTSFQSYRYLNGTVDSPPDRIIQAKFPVAFCVLAKDEKDLSEWIQYHSQLGVSKFYIMDEYSNPPLSESIADFIQSGLAEYKLYSFFWNKFWHSLGFQTKNHLRTAFDECLILHGHKHRWMGFLDADEFVILKVCITSLQRLIPSMMLGTVSPHDPFLSIFIPYNAAEFDAAISPEVLI